MNAESVSPDPWGNVTRASVTNVKLISHNFCEDWDKIFGDEC